MIEPARRHRVLDDVGSGVGRRERDGDDEPGGGEAEEAQDQRLTTPSRQQFLEDLDAALAVRTELGDAAIHRQRAEECQQDQHERRQRRQHSGGEKRDAWLVAEGRKVIDPRQAHDLPPGRLVCCVVAAGVHDTFEEPGVEPAGAPVHQISPRTSATSSSSSLASLNTPSQRATTTEARQLPITLVIVRPMSISVSTPRISVTPSSGS